MQKEAIIQKLKERGCRITKQRLMLLDIIMEEDYSCCKEIYYRASQLDPQIGISAEKTCIGFRMYVSVTVRMDV